MPQESGNHNGSLFIQPLDHHIFNASVKIEGARHGKPIHDLKAVPAVSNDACLLEDGKVLGDVGDLRANFFGNFTDTLFSAWEKLYHSRRRGCPMALKTSAFSRSRSFSLYSIIRTPFTV